MRTSLQMCVALGALSVASCSREDTVDETPFRALQTIAIDTARFPWSPTYDTTKFERHEGLWQRHGMAISVVRPDICDTTRPAICDVCAIRQDLLAEGRRYHAVIYADGRVHCWAEERGHREVGLLGRMQDSEVFNLFSFIAGTNFDVPVRQQYRSYHGPYTMTLIIGRTHSSAFSRHNEQPIENRIWAVQQLIERALEEVQWSDGSTGIRRFTYRN